MVFSCIFALLVFDALSKVYPAYWSNYAKVQLNDAVKKCFAARARGIEIEESRIKDFYQILFLNRPAIASGCSFIVKAIDYPWWHPARFNRKRWRPEDETWFAVEVSYEGDIPLKKICGDALKPGCSVGGRWRSVVDNRD